MCGIVGAFSFTDDPVNGVILKQFDKQRNRGTQGFGLFDYDYKNIVRATKEESIVKWLAKYPSTNILFHHRLPTSTANVKSAAHPFSTKDFFKTNYVLVHNGVIGNDLDLKTEHDKLGIVYQSTQQDGTFNDSEALLWDVALYLEGKQPKLKVEGSVAFVCIALGKGNKHDRMYFARNTSPLRLFKDDVAGIMLSSEGKGESVDPDTLYCFDYVNHQLSTKDCEILTGWERYQASQPYNSRGYESGRAQRGYVEDEDDYRYEEDEYIDASVEEGRKFIRTYKADKVLFNGEVSALYEKILYDNHLDLSMSMVQTQFEYDCLCLLYDYKSLCGHSTKDVNYSLELYERVEARIDGDMEFQESMDIKARQGESL